MSDIYVGVMSGTSGDGMDCAALKFSEREAQIVAKRVHAFPDALRDVLAQLTDNQAVPPKEYGRLDDALGDVIADGVEALLTEAGISNDQVAAIGSHGHTVFHQPPENSRRGFTLQFGNPNIIAARTTITTVADIRRMDMAFGGQGAPLAPAFHDWLWRDKNRCRIVVNLGGIANVTVLDRGTETRGFDTGPANTLIDRWTRRHQGTRFDDKGRWAAKGGLLSKHLSAWMSDPYFALPPPKSTGPEYFNIDWLERSSGDLGLDQEDPEDVARTLVDLTAMTVHAAIASYQPEEIVVCGGGAHNDFLMSRIAFHCSPSQVVSSAERGLHPDWVEAAAFAWFARQRLAGRPSNVPTVTGARQDTLLGAVYSSQ